MQVCAAGALIAILIKEGMLTLSSSTCTDDFSEVLYLQNLSEMSLEGFLYVDQASFHALQIFHVRLPQYCFDNCHLFPFFPFIILLKATSFLLHMCQDLISSIQWRFTQP